MSYTISQFRKDVRTPYAWPGGYPTYFITSDGCALSIAAAKANRRAILEAIHDHLNDGWRVEAMDINWEDNDLYCDDSGEKIESAYGD
jgi:hypothetical protein